MGWKSFLIGFAALVAYCFGAIAADAEPRDTRVVTEVALPDARAAQQAPVPLRPSQGMPRYSTMTPPPATEEVPSAAPTTRVNVAPAQPISQASPVSAEPRPTERVTVAGQRPSEESFYRLGPGDKVRVTVFNETDLSGDFAVDGQGYVRLPLVGQVQAAGLTSFTLEERIGSAFVGGGFLLTPRVSVEIVTYRPFYIVGEVAKPGEYAYVNAMSVPNAIALAGGYTDRAVTSTIWVRHQNESKEREVHADETTRILPGDVVRVQRTAYWSIMTLLAPLISPFATTAYILK
jgi:protein involved in polysaccharide export with SLBB domain